MEGTAVKLNITHNKRSLKAMEIRFERSATIAKVKVNPI